MTRITEARYGNNRLTAPTARQFAQRRRPGRRRASDERAGRARAGARPQPDRAARRVARGDGHRARRCAGDNRLDARPAGAFEADGREQSRPCPTGRQMRVRASLQGERLELSYLGDAPTITMYLLADGERPGPARHAPLLLERLDNESRFQSVYDKTAEVARLTPRRGTLRREPIEQRLTRPGGRPAAGWSKAYSDLAVLNENLNTRDAREGDKIHPAGGVAHNTGRGDRGERPLGSTARVAFGCGRHDARLPAHPPPRRRSFNFAGSIETIRRPT